MIFYANKGVLLQTSNVWFRLKFRSVPISGILQSFY